MSEAAGSQLAAVIAVTRLSPTSTAREAALRCRWCVSGWGTWGL